MENKESMNNALEKAENIAKYDGYSGTCEI